MNHRQKQRLELMAQAILEDYNRVNQEFTREAIRQWDAVGQGCFPLFIKVAVYEMWVDMVSMN